MKDAEPLESETPAPEPARVRPPAPVGDDMLDIRFLGSAIWGGKWIILLFMIVSASLGVRDMRGFGPTYEAAMVVAPQGQSSRSDGGPSAVIRQFGVEVGGAEGGPIARLELMLYSLALGNALDEKHGLVRRLWSNAWDPIAQAWIKPQGREFEIRQRVREFLHQPGWTEPSVRALRNHLSAAINFKQIGRTDFRRISYRNADPETALFILTAAFEGADDLIRNQDQAEIDSQRQWVTARLENTEKFDEQNVLQGLLSQVEQRAMFLESSERYTVQVLEPPSISGTPSSPSARTKIGVPMFAAFVVGVLFVVLFRLFRRESQGANP